jgi:signal transduction histidine kinase
MSSMSLTPDTLTTALVDRLFALLLEDLGFEGAELWQIRHPGNAAPGEQESVYRSLRRGGTREGSPSRRRLLAHGSLPVASLASWGEPRAGADRAEHALEGLLPWLALALDHQRMTTLLERQAARLEDHVRDRTADLRSANRRLAQEIEQRRGSLDALLEAGRARASAERLASLGTLAAGIAHEINNPIGAILAAAQLAELEAELPPRLASALVDIVHQARRCGVIVRSLLQFSHEEPTEKWACSLPGLVQRAVQRTSPFARAHRAQIHFEPPPDPIQARINPIQIEQALVQLLRNAVEAGAGRIVVELRSERREEPPSEVTIDVLDDGPGLSSREQERIFDPFFTTRHTAGATGLGSSIAHGIAVEHGGSLEIESLPGSGTRARLRLPRLEPARSR